MRKKSNLVVLLFDDSSDVELKPIDEIEGYSFKIDARKGSWSYDYSDNFNKEKSVELKIGESRIDIGPNDFDVRRGIIGIYDRTVLKHLQRMVHATNRAISKY